MRSFSYLLLISLSVACIETEQRELALVPGTVTGQPDSDNWRAVAPLDTALVLTMMELPESLSIPWRTDTTGRIAWQAAVDTITVRYIAYACTCPDYEILDSVDIWSPSYVQSGITTVYVTPSAPSVEIPWRLGVSGNTFSLVGQFSMDTLRPPQTMGPPWPGYFFRYHSMKPIKPYEVWGPHVFDASMDAAAGEDPWVPTQLTVR